MTALVRVNDALDVQVAAFEKQAMPNLDIGAVAHDNPVRYTAFGLFGLDQFTTSQRLNTSPAIGVPQPATVLLAIFVDDINRLFDAYAMP